MESSYLNIPLPYKTDSYDVSRFLTRNKKEHEAIAYMYNRKEPMILFGLAGIVNQLKNTHVTQLDIHNAKQDALANDIDFNDELWYRMTDKYQGYPFKAVTITQVPEFALYPAGCPLAKIESSSAPELVTYFEGALTKCFFPSMVLTRLWAYKEAGIQNLHNFSWRSCFTDEDAALATMAFSMLYDGTDNFLINYLKRAVNDCTNPDRHLLAPYKQMLDDMRPKTIIALNHREVQSWKNEFEMIDHITSIGRPIAFPVDTYDAERFIINYLGYSLRKATEGGTSLFYRIDSGDHILQAKHILNQIVTFKEMNVLNNNKVIPRFGVIIGDHLDLPQIIKVLNELEKWTVERKITLELNDYVFFGLGGSFLEGISRDKGGIVTKLGWNDYVGNTMKTAQGKESLLGKLTIHLKGDQYRVSFNDEFYYGFEKDTQRNYQAMKSGFSNVLTPKELLVTQEVRAAQQAFKDKILK